MGDLISWLIQVAGTWFERVIVLGYIIIQWWVSLPLALMIVVAAIAAGLIYLGFRLRRKHAIRLNQMMRQRKRKRDTKFKD